VKVFVERRQLREDFVFGVLLFGPGAEGDGASVGVDGSVGQVFDSFQHRSLFRRRRFVAKLFVVESGELIEFALQN